MTGEHIPGKVIVYIDGIAKIEFSNHSFYQVLKAFIEHRF